MPLNLMVEATNFSEFEVRRICHIAISWGDKTFNKQCVADLTEKSSVSVPKSVYFGRCVIGTPTIKKFQITHLFDEDWKLEILNANESQQLQFQIEQDFGFRKIVAVQWDPLDVPLKSVLNIRIHDRDGDSDVKIFLHGSIQHEARQ
mgnify:CR=1 FL=1|jgi:hypothetical protein